MSDQPATKETALLRRKIEAGPRESGAAPLANAARPGRVWRRAVAHGFTRSIDLACDVTDMETGTISADAVGPLVGEGALCVLLDGPGGNGAAILDPGLLSAAIEMQTMGKLQSRPVQPRAATATDAALVADPLDAVLAAQETLAEELAVAGMSSGYRYATRIEDPRDLANKLDDAPFERITLDLKLGSADRTGQLILVLPPPAKSDAMDDVGTAEGPGAAWQMGLESRLLGSELSLRAELARMALPIHAVTELAVGDLLPLGRDTIGRVRLVTVGGDEVATGRLGQAAGKKAIRLEPPRDEDTMFAPADLAVAAPPKVVIPEAPRG